MAPTRFTTASTWTYRIDVLQFFAGVHFDRAEALRLSFACRLSDIIRAIPTDPGVDADFIPHRPAQQRISRCVVILAVNIPQCLIDTSHRAHHHRATAIKACPVQHLPQIFDMAGIASDQYRLDFAHRRLNGPSVALDNRFAPAAQAFIGRDLQEEPAWRHLK